MHVEPFYFGTTKIGWSKKVNFLCFTVSTGHFFCQKVFILVVLKKHLILIVFKFIIYSQIIFFMVKNETSYTQSWNSYLSIEYNKSSVDWNVSRKAVHKWIKDFFSTSSERKRINWIQCGTIFFPHQSFLFISSNISQIKSWWNTFYLICLPATPEPNRGKSWWPKRVSYSGNIWNN